MSSPLLKRFFFSFAPLIFLWVIFEVLLRFVWAPELNVKQIDVGLHMKPDFNRIWTLEKGTVQNFGVSVQIGDDGLRLGAVEGGQKKWMTLGDSSIFGHGLSHKDTLHHQLKKSFQESGIEVDVLCGGVPGYSILQTMLLMDDVGWEKNLDVILIGNLWSDNNFDHFIDKEWLVALNSPTASLNKLLGNSMVWSWFSNRIRPFVPPERGRRHGRISWVRKPYEKGQRRVALNDYARALDSLLLRAAQNKVGVLVLQPMNRYRLEGIPGQATWDPYFQAQRHVAERRGVVVVDALEPLKSSGIGSEAAFLDELHPTGLANKLISKAVVSTAITAGWPEKNLLPDLKKAPVNVKYYDPWEKHAPKGSSQH